MKNVISKTIIAFVLITGALAFIGYKFHKNTESLTYINNEILRSYAIISANKDISSQAKDMVLSTRGFLITEDSTYLTPHLEAVKKYPVSLDHLRKNAKHRGKDLQSNVEKLAALMENRQQYSDSYVITRKDKGLLAAVQLFKTQNKGNNIMDTMRKTIRQIENTEINWLQNLLKNREKQVSELSNLLLILIAVIISTLILVLVILLRDITGREKAEENLRKLNQTLEQQVMARTQDLQRSFEDMEIKVKFRNLELEKQNLALNKKIAELEK